MIRTLLLVIALAGCSTQETGSPQVLIPPQTVEASKPEDRQNDLNRQGSITRRTGTDEALAICSRAGRLAYALGLPANMSRMCGAASSL